MSVNSLNIWVMVSLLALGSSQGRARRLDRTGNVRHESGSEVGRNRRRLRAADDSSRQLHQGRRSQGDGRGAADRRLSRASSRRCARRPRSDTSRPATRSSPSAGPARCRMAQDRTISVVTDAPIFFVGGGSPDAKPRAGYELAVLQLKMDSSGIGEGTHGGRRPGQARRRDRRGHRSICRPADQAGVGPTRNQVRSLRCLSAHLSLLSYWPHRGGSPAQSYKNTAPESFRANAQATASGGGVAAALVFQVDAYTPDTDRERLVATLTSGGSPAFVEALKKEKAIGYVQVGERKVAVRYARETATRHRRTAHRARHRRPGLLRRRRRVGRQTAGRIRRRGRGVRGRHAWASGAAGWRWPRG